MKNNSLISPNCVMFDRKMTAIRSDVQTARDVIQGGHEALCKESPPYYYAGREK